MQCEGEQRARSWEPKVSSVFSDSGYCDIIRDLSDFSLSCTCLA